MNPFKRAINIFCGFKRKIYIRKKVRELQSIVENSKNTKSRIFVFCAPIHSNLGDQAQLLCWLRLFKLWYPNHEIVQVSTAFRTFNTIRDIRHSLRSGDKLFIHSGYLFFDPHPDLPFILDIVRAFYDIPLTILPQTVNLMDEWMQKVVSRELDSHNNLTLMCRDEVSFEKAKLLFKNVHLKLMPDVVTSLIGNPEFTFEDAKRDGIIFCLRNDLEKFYSEADLADLIGQFSEIRTLRCDTNIKANMQCWDKKRDELLKELVKKFSSYKVIITDRYHGTILGAIANTPVIVINSSDHKLSSGVKWFQQNQISSVMYASSLNEAAKLAKKILADDVPIKNPTTFFDLYWKKM